jgi:hypothetical protein
MPKNLFKKCPKCKFTKCWIQAPKCEQCDYDFKLGRVIRAREIQVDDEDDFIPVPAEQPKQTFKSCPQCNNRCWHLAPACEKCEWDFRTGKPKESVIAKKISLIEVTSYPSYFGGASIGCAMVICPALSCHGRNDFIVKLKKLKPPSFAKATRNSVSQWIQKMQDHGRTGHVEYTADALKYIVCSNYEMNNPIYNQLIGANVLENSLLADKLHKKQKAEIAKTCVIIDEIYNDLADGRSLSFIPEKDENEEIPEVREKEPEIAAPVTEQPIMKRGRGRPRRV